VLTPARSPLDRITDFGFARRMDADGRVVVPAQTRNLPIRIGAPESLASDDAEYSAKVHRVHYTASIYTTCAWLFWPDCGWPVAVARPSPTCGPLAC
jgi:hypothetical protein